MTDFKDRISKLLFLEFKREKASKLFNINILGEDLFLPLNPEFLVHQINSGDDLKKLPINEFIIGMAYCLGADNDFKYNEDYKNIIKTFKDADKIVKFKISELIKNEKSLDAFILLNGLYKATNLRDVEDVLLSFGEELAIKNKDLIDNVLYITDKAIENNNINGYLIKGSLESLLKNNSKALVNFQEYLNKGGSKTNELILKMNDIKREDDLEKAFSLVTDAPNKALEILLPYYKEDSNNTSLLFNIAVSYRNLKNHEKAIYYLNEALAIDNEFLDVQNELGINYAMLGDYESSKKYFKAVFDITKDIAPLTNLIIAMFNTNEVEEAKYLLTKAEALNTNDEIIEAIKKTYL